MKIAIIERLSIILRHVDNGEKIETQHKKIAQCVAQCKHTTL